MAVAHQRFEVAVVRDATAGPRLPSGDGYLAALTNYSFLAHAVWMTEETVSHIRGGGSATVLRTAPGGERP